MKPTLASLFPNASQSTVDANPQLSAPNGGSGKQNDSRGILKPNKAKPGVMNKTESEFGLMLEAQKREGLISRYEFEGITLRWADMKYTPDFITFPGLSPESTTEIQLIEVKGGHIWDRDIVRFKGARAYWPEFTFEMWQKVKVKDCTPVTSSWKRKY